MTQNILNGIFSAMILMLPSKVVYAESSLMNYLEQAKQAVESNSHVRFAKLVFFNDFKQQLEVTATAYTSHENQTDDTPDIAAWGDKLTPDMKVIAVSRDLLDEHGLSRGSRVKIKGLPGHYVVLDKMNKRWRRKIDIYMGKDLQKAFSWGRQKVIIEWNALDA